MIGRERKERRTDKDIISEWLIFEMHRNAIQTAKFETGQWLNESNLFSLVLNSFKFFRFKHVHRRGFYFLIRIPQ